MSKFSVGEWVMLESPLTAFLDGQRFQVEEVLEANLGGNVVCPVKGVYVSVGVGKVGYYLNWEGVPSKSFDGTRVTTYVCSESTLRKIPKDNEAAGEWGTMMDNLLDTPQSFKLESNPYKTAVTGKEFIRT